MINKLAKSVHENAVKKGFYEGEKNTGEILCLIHSEVSEALEADRVNNNVLDRFDILLSPFEYFKNFNEFLNSLTDDSVDYTDDEKFKRAFSTIVKDTFEDELADVVIRVMDLAAYKGIDLEAHIKAKIRYNSLREHKHGKKY